MELSDYSLELGTLTGLVVVLSLSPLLPSFSFIATLAGGAVAAYLHARNYKQGLLVGLLTGLSVVLLMFMDMRGIQGIPVEDLVSSIIVYSSADTTQGLFLFAALYTVLSTVFVAMVVGEINYEDEFSFSVVDTSPGR